jgi:hypothetical protein
VKKKSRDLLLKVQKNKLLAVAKELESAHQKVATLLIEKEKIEEEKKLIKQERSSYLRHHDFSRVENCDLYLEALDQNCLELMGKKNSCEQELHLVQEKYRTLRHERKKIELLVEKH